MAGTHGRGIQTAAFFVHPRIRLAQLFHADGGIVSPLRALADDQAFVKALEVRVHAWLPHVEWDETWGWLFAYTTEKLTSQYFLSPSHK